MIKQTSKFCPYCSNDKAVNGSYQEIGCFSIMTKVGLKWECDNCGYDEDTGK